MNKLLLYKVVQNSSSIFAIQTGAANYMNFSKIIPIQVDEN
jgi:hypothetical protein